jgi:hypothetical protein
VATSAAGTPTLRAESQATSLLPRAPDLHARPGPRRRLALRELSVKVYYCCVAAVYAASACTHPGGFFCFGEVGVFWWFPSCFMLQSSHSFRRSISMVAHNIRHKRMLLPLPYHGSWIEPSYLRCEHTAHKMHAGGVSADCFVPNIPP